MTLSAQGERAGCDKSYKLGSMASHRRREGLTTASLYLSTGECGYVAFTGNDIMLCAAFYMKFTARDDAPVAIQVVMHGDSC
jgi:hypothetical protein